METITKETHIIYMTYDTTTGEYYIGLRSWRGDKERREYFGSYKKDSDWRPNKKNLVRITLAEYPDRETLKDEEVEWIRPHLGKPLCKNTHNNRLHFDTWGKPGRWLGKKLPKETCEKISESKKGKPSWNKGKTNIYSYETLEKISKSSKGRIKSEETKEKLRQANLGRIITEEWKKKISEAHKGKPKSEEQITKQRETMKNKPKLECPHCGGLFDARNARRWHFDNCKKKLNLLL